MNLSPLTLGISSITERRFSNLNSIKRILPVFNLNSISFRLSILILVADCGLRTAAAVPGMTLITERST